jgi:integrase
MTAELVTITPNAVVIPTNATAATSLDQNPVAVYLASLRETGRRSMHHYLNVVAALLSNNQQLDALSFDWSKVRYQHTAAVAAQLQGKYKPATANTILAALRRVLKEAWRLGQLDAEDYRRAIDLRPIRGESSLKGRALKSGEISALMQACSNDATAAGVRDAAIISVLYGAGLRRSEIASLTLADYHCDDNDKGNGNSPESGDLLIRSGKGGKDRISYLGAGPTAALNDWLQIRGKQAGPLFNPINKGGNICRANEGQQLAPITDQAVLNILAKRGKEARLQHFSPHDLRRTFISDLLDAGADIVTVQKLAGHSNVQTTAKYDRRGETAKRRAAGMLHVPYQTRTLKLD